jgi:ABC-2 type transport system permease protein
VNSIAPPADAAAGRPLGGIDPILNAYRVELTKLRSQLIVRLLAIACLAAPFAFAAVLKIQSGTPSDALFGAYVHASGFAISLVILSFAGNWGLPVIAGLVGGDLFAAEDRHGTWKTILTRSSTRTDIYVAKLCAAATLTVVFGLLLAVASVLAGVIFVGAHSLVNLSGVTGSAGETFLLTLISWLICLLPALAYTAIAVLFSIASRNGIVGVLGPLLVALMTQLLQLIGKGTIVHFLLPGSAFLGWHGLFTSPRFFGPLLVSCLVSLGWIVGCVLLSWRLLRRRDFVAKEETDGFGWRTPLKAVVATAALIAVLALLTNVGPTGDTQHRLSAAIGAEFNNLTLLQQEEIGRHVPAGAKLDVLPECNRHAAKAVGPGDWSCSLNVYLPQNHQAPFSATSVEYDVNLESDGCYKAQSPPTFIGGPTMRGTGGAVTNPLYIVYGCFDTL